MNPGMLVFASLECAYPKTCGSLWDFSSVLYRPRSGVTVWDKFYPTVKTHLSPNWVIERMLRTLAGLKTVSFMEVLTQYFGTWNKEG